MENLSASNLLATKPRKQTFFLLLLQMEWTPLVPLVCWILLFIIKSRSCNHPLTCLKLLRPRLRICGIMNFIMLFKVAFGQTRRLGCRFKAFMVWIPSKNDLNLYEFSG
ncbi:hypothetical protein KSP39_PZI004866 [Platanthera zijinensis]|uniref:Uncharacterized protein n=1 Tax=Platanthera zijinensis TaxID=2320716 RepID=A0AAP0GD60_9ASPA